MVDLDTILEARKPRQTTASILVDPELQARYEALAAQLDDARAADKREGRGWKSDVPRLEAALDQLEAELAEHRHEFRFQALGRKEYSKLLDEFAPREGNRIDRLTGFNSDEFPPALLAASAVDPEMSLEQASRIWDEWSDVETTALFSAALKAQKEMVDVPFTRNGSAMATSSTEKSSNTPPTTDSPTQSS